MKIAVPWQKHGKSSSAQNTMLGESTCKCSFLHDLLVFLRNDDTDMTQYSLIWLVKSATQTLL